MNTEELYDILFDYIVDHDDKPVSIIEFTNHVKYGKDVDKNIYKNIGTESIHTAFYNMSSKYQNIHEIYKFTKYGKPITCLIMVNNNVDSKIKNYYETGNYMVNNNYSNNEQYYVSDKYTKFLEKYKDYMENTPYLKHCKLFVNLLIEEQDVIALEKYLRDNPSCVLEKDIDNYFPIKYAMNTNNKLIINIIQNHTSKQLLKLQIKLNKELKSKYNKQLIASSMVIVFMGFVIGLCLTSYN